MTKVDSRGISASHLLDHLLDEEMAERDPGQPALAVGDRIECRRRRPLGVDPLAVGRQDRIDPRGNAAGERHLDEDQRLIDQRRMEKGIAAPVGRIDARAQVVPVADRVHRLVADDLLQQIRRRRPVDGPQHQEAAIEPGREQVEKVVVDGGEIVAMIHRLDQLGAHAHQRRRAPGRQIEAPEELEPPRLGRAMEPGCGRIGGRAHPGRGRGISWARSGPNRLASASKKAMRGPVLSSL